MADFKKWWYKLVACGLWYRHKDLQVSFFDRCKTVKEQLDISEQFRIKYEYADKLSRSLQIEISTLKKDCSKLVTQLAATKEHPLKHALDTNRNHASQQRIRELEAELMIAKKDKITDVDATMKILREHMQVDVTLPGKIDLLRTQLKQELAYIVYLEENIIKDTVLFNDLSLEIRKEYFKRAEEQTK